jgi:hypothetical protein
MKFNIVVASDINLKRFINPCIDSIKKIGYDPMVYDLGGLGYGKPFESTTSDKALQKFPKKPFVIKDALQRIPKDSWLAWIDIDCIMQHSIDDAIGEYDVGVTFRKNHLNSGVNFWKHNSRALHFLDVWSKEALLVGGDQNGLNRICKITSGSSVNTILDIEGAKVKVFDSRVYNNFFFKKDQSNARILHYKSKFRNRFPFDIEEKK